MSSLYDWKSFELLSLSLIVVDRVIYYTTVWMLVLEVNGLEFISKVLCAQKHFLGLGDMEKILSRYVFPY